MEKMLKKGLVRAVEHEVVPAAPPRVRVDPGWFDGFEVPFLSAPISVDVFVTNRCNLSCVHCFSSRGDEAVHDLPLGTLKEIFSQLERMGVFEVRINGGEPLMHPEISQIISTLGAMRFRKVIITNGTLLNEELVHLLKETRSRRSTTGSGASGDLSGEPSTLWTSCGGWGSTMG
jgi:sulfatase maturation enzyme AslB (radical SAM superfamily)